MPSDSAIKGLFIVFASVLFALQCFATDKWILKVTFKSEKNAFNHPGTIYHTLDNNQNYISYLGQLKIYNTYLPGNFNELQLYLKAVDDSVIFKKIPKPYDSALHNVVPFSCGNSWCVQVFGNTTLPVKHWTGDKWEVFTSDFSQYYLGNYFLDKKQVLGLERFGYFLNNEKTSWEDTSVLNYYFIHDNSLWRHVYYGNDNKLNELKKYSIKNKELKFEKTYNLPSEMPAADFIYCLLTDSLGNLYLGTNTGNMYFANDTVFKVIRDREIKNVSFQPYFFAQIENQILAGEYPAGKLFYLNDSSFHYLENNIGFHPSSTKNAREAQSFSIYGNKQWVGVWPWGELWSATLGNANTTFELSKRLFSLPEYSKIDAPYIDYFQKTQGVYNNSLGQRLNYLFPSNGKLLAFTGAKNSSVDNNTDSLMNAVSNLDEYGAVWEISQNGNFSIPFQSGKKQKITIKVKRDKVIIRNGWKRTVYNQKIDLDALIYNAKNLQTAKGIFGPTNLQIIKTKQRFKLKS